jgi:ribonuclease HI
MTGSVGGPLVIQIDGSSKGNPGPAGIGVRVVRQDGTVSHEVSQPIGIRTNNQAEYEALIAALKLASESSSAGVVIRTDSELVLRQMTGRYRVKDPKLRQLHMEATRLLSGMPWVILEHVGREANRAADRLANAGSDAASSRGHVG